MEEIAWLSSVLLSICGVPAAYSAWKNKSSSIHAGSVILWTAGEVLGLIYVVALGIWPLVLNYGINTVATIIICKYKFFQKEK